MRVALVKPPSEHLGRGIGFYAERLFSALEKDIKVEWLNLSEINKYSKNFDLIHFTYFDLFFLTLPIFRDYKSVVTVFDLTPIILEKLYPRGIRGEIKWQIQKRRLKTADAVITISESAKGDITRIIDYPKDKIFVTYLAAGPDYKPLNYQRENTILYIGDVNPNKNIITFLKAMVLLPKYKLVLVGKAFLESDLPEAAAIRKEIKDLGIGNRVTLTGFVSEEEKITLLNRAKVYCQPSIYEGFCLPVLEALSCGCPVVCGRNSSLLEVAGEAAVYADVLAPLDIADKLLKVLELPKNESEKLSAKCLAQAKKFSWEKMAKETAAVYSKVAKTSSVSLRIKRCK